MTPIRLLLATVALALASVVTLPTHAAVLLPDAVAHRSAPAHIGKDTPVKIRNTAPRIVHLNLGAPGIVAINPLQEVDLTGDQARAAKAILDGPSRALVDDGTLVVDGDAKAPPPNPAPPPGAIASTNMGDPRLAPTAAELGHDTEPSGTPDTPSSSGGGKRSK